MDEMKSSILACTLHFSESKQYQATAHLFEHLYSGYNFWYGVIQIGEFPTENLPDRVQVAFKDGRKGLVSFCAGYVVGEYMEFTFTGVTPLKK